MKTIFILFGIFFIFSQIICISAEPITVTALPSCNNPAPYNYKTMIYENYCPNCGSHDSLTINPKGVYEMELTCSICDSDYCAYCGKEKGYIGSYLLSVTSLKIFGSQMFNIPQISSKSLNTNTKFIYNENHI